MVDTCAGHSIEDDPTPVALLGSGSTAVRIENAAAAKPIIFNRSKDHRPVHGSLSDQIGGAAFRFDAGAYRFDDHARIDLQPTAEPRISIQGSAGVADNKEVFREDVRDIIVIEARRYRQFVNGISGQCFDTDE